MQYPARYTKPLSEDFPSDGPRLIQLVEKIWRTPDGKRLQLDPWQKWLIKAILERYPADYSVESLQGRLRYRQVVVSMGRQNGKSVLAAVLSLYGLIQQCKGPTVIGVASNREQADIIYNRTKYVVSHTPQLNAKIKPTGTRGLRFRDGSGSYEIRASKSEALQGIPVTLALCDELHILKPEVWDSLVNGTRAQADGLVLGITTAGDDHSTLLKRLYAQGQQAIESTEAGRFGFFVFEAPEGANINTPGAIEAANPSVECGRVSLDNVLSDVAELPETDQIRYTLNRFVANITSWMPFSLWRDAPRSNIDLSLPIFYSIDRTPDWSYASITAHQKTDAGIIQSELVMSIVKPTQDLLSDKCQRLNGARSVFVVDNYSLGALAKDLKSKGLNVRTIFGNEVAQASSTAYAVIAGGRIAHDHAELLDVQVPRGQRKNIGEGWKVSRKDTSVEIDALVAMINGIFVAETELVPEVQLFC